MKIHGKELSEDTIAEACEAYGIGFEKKKFEPIKIHLGCFVIDVDVNNGLVKTTTGSHYPSSGCYQSPDGARKFIKALQLAIAFIENET